MTQAGAGGLHSEVAELKVGGGSRKEAAESRVKKWERPKVPGGALSWHYFWATGKSHA